jgi:hypothetical protein
VTGPYVANLYKAPEPPPPNEVRGKKEYEVEAILKSSYRHNRLSYKIKYNPEEESVWL